MFVNNSELTFATAGTEVTYWFSRSGTDTATVIYLPNQDANPDVARKVVLRPDQTITVTEINQKIMKNPITVTSTGFTINLKEMIGASINQMKVVTSTANTNIKVTVIGSA